MSEVVSTTHNESNKNQHENKNGTWKGAFNAFNVAFDGIRRNPTPALLFLGVYVGFSLISALTQNGLAHADDRYINYQDIALLLFLLAIPVYSLAIADGKRITIGEFMRFDLFKYVSVFAVSILFMIIVAFSFVLLIIPVIWTAAWFAMSYYAVPDKGIGPIAALKESKRLSSQHKAKVWGIIGVTILVSVVAGLIAFIPLIGAILAAGVTLWAAVAGAILYRWLQQHGASE